MVIVPIGGVFDANATEFPYNAGLAIGGTSGNLLWKGSKVAVVSDIKVTADQAIHFSITSDGILQVTY